MLKLGGGKAVASCLLHYRVGNFYVTTEKDAFALNLGLMPNNPQVGIDAAIEIVEKARRWRSMNMASRDL
jgi:hypothetical protein